MNPSLAKDAKRRGMFSGGFEQNKRIPIVQEAEMPTRMNTELLGALGVLGER